MMGAMTQRVFITGGSGFIGRALATHFTDQGWEMAGMDLHADPSRGVVAGDISSPGAWQDAVAGSDLVIHTAAMVSNVASDETTWRMNVLGTKNVVDAAARAGARLVHFSSIRAFSDLGYQREVTEEDPVRTDGNSYVDTKVAGEQVVLQAHAAGRVDARIVRPGDVYGPGSRPWILIPLELIRSRQFVLPARGNGIFSPVYIDDLIRGVYAVGTRPEASGQVVTLSGGVGVTCREFFEHHHRWLGLRGPTCLPTSVAVALAQGAGAVARARGIGSEASATAIRYFTRQVTYSIDKARDLLGHEPQVTLADGMARTEHWLRSEGLIS